MKNGMLIGGTILLLAGTSAFGADDVGLNYGDYYRGNEFSVDAFGSGSLGKYSIDHFSGNRLRHNTRLGLGAGINYFFNRYVGIGADAYSENTTGPFVDSTSGNLILRVPLGQSGFAPFAYGGGGHQFDLAHVSFAQVGAGMEYRFTPHIGTFLDARWVFPDRTKYYGVARLGLRFAF